MDLALETKLSEKAALKAYDERALTKEEQDQLNQIKVLVWYEVVGSLSVRALFHLAACTDQNTY